MARYIVTSGTPYDPLSYEEIMKPVALAQEAHDKTITDIDTMALKAGEVGSLIDENSPRYKAMYDSYKQEEQNFLDDILANGVSSSSVRRLSDLRRNFSNTTAKINAALQRKAAVIKDQEERKAKDPTLFIDKDAHNINLDTWYDDVYADGYNSFSGNTLYTLGEQVGKNLKNEIETNPETLKAILGDTLSQGVDFTGFRAAEIEQAIQNELIGVASSNNRVASLQNAIATIYGSTGLDNWATEEQKKQALKYIGDGIYSAIGSISDVPATSMRGKAGVSDVDSPVPISKPPIVTLRNNNLSGISNGKDAKELSSVSECIDALSIVNTLKKSNALRKPDGTLTDAANKAVAILLKNNTYKTLTNGEDHYLTNEDLDVVISDLKTQLDAKEKELHQYYFNGDVSASNNIVTNIFKLNIGQLSGKQGDNIAAAFARYSDGKAVKGKDLQALLDDKAIAIGFDAKQGMLTLERTGATSAEKQSGKSYDDKKVFLNPEKLLTGGSAFVNTGQMLYILNEKLPAEFSALDKDTLKNIIANLSYSGETIRLSDLAKYISEQYKPMITDGDDTTKKIYNGLVSAFMLGLYDSSLQWTANVYKDNWTEKAGNQ